MFASLRRAARDLSGRSDRDLLEHLLGQLDATLDGVRLARRVADGGIGPSEARETMDETEERGDTRRRDLTVQLSTALAAPMDREDLFRLSRSVDDVLDNLRDLVREMDLYDIDVEPLLVAPLAGVEDGLVHLRAAVESILDRPDEARRKAKDAKKNHVRIRFQRSMAELLAGDDRVTGRVLRRRELLRRVDVVGLRLGEAADALTDGAVKRSH